MAADKHNPSQDDEHSTDTTTDAATEPTRLTGEEAVAALRDSGGYVVLRYDTGGYDIEYRYNPAAETFEQLAIHTDEEGSVGSRLDGYYRMDEAAVKTLFAGPGSTELRPPTPVAFTDSHFPGVNCWPDTLYDDADEADE